MPNETNLGKDSDISSPHFLTPSGGSFPKTWLPCHRALAGSKIPPLLERSARSALSMHTPGRELARSWGARLGWRLSLQRGRCDGQVSLCLLRSFRKGFKTQVSGSQKGNAGSGSRPPVSAQSPSSARKRLSSPRGHRGALAIHSGRRGDLALRAAGEGLNDTHFRVSAAALQPLLHCRPAGSAGSNVTSFRRRGLL